MSFAAFPLLVSSTKNENDDSTGNDANDSYDELLFWVILTVLALTFLYLFTRYLLERRRMRIKEDTESTESTENTGSGSDRRHRFARMRLNSSKPWLNPLDAIRTEDRSELSGPVEDLLKHLDADELIQSDISPTSVLNRHDPFRLGDEGKMKSGISDYFGVASAAVLAMLSVFILSNLEEL